MIINKNMSCITFLVVLVLIIIVLYILYNGDYLKKKEKFVNDFVIRQSLSTNRIWKNAKLVMIRNVYTGMAITAIPRMSTIRLEPLDRLNQYQYFIMSPEGYFMTPFTQLCISYPSPSGTGNDGLNVSPILNICSQYGGQQFIYEPKSKHIINIIGMPYTAINRKRLIGKQQKRCLTYYPVIGRGPSRRVDGKLNRCNLKDPSEKTPLISQGKKRIAIVDTDFDIPHEYKQWDIILVSENDLLTAQGQGYDGYTKITASNNNRDYYRTRDPLQFNTEKWKYDSLIRPYFDGKTLYSNLPTSNK
jgi:hypothetical protein